MRVSPDRSEQLRRLFEKLIDHPADERAAFLEEVCRSDPALRRELTSLLDDPEDLPGLSPLAWDTIRPLLEAMRVAATPTEGLIGRRISHFQIVEQLGAGGMGVVYKAVDTQLDRTVGLKFLPPELTRDPTAKTRFVREAKAASALDHNNICTIYEIGETPAGQLFIAMAHYTGETLKEKIERGPLPLEEALDYAVQMADGLSRAHAAGIVHRDVKPANVMITDHGQIKIVDFGLAKVAGLTQITQTGSTMGTAAYMSPEQARGEAVDEQTDVWSLGVVLYEMLTGGRPFRGEFHHAVIYSILNEAPEPIRQANPSVPPELERTVDRALQKKREGRYTAAADLLKDLRGYQDSLRGKGAFDLRTVLRRARKPRVAVPAAVVLLLLVLSSIWFFDRQAKIRWAREVALPEIGHLVQASWRDYTEAYGLAERAERYIPNDPELAELMASSSLHIDIRTEPPGAEIYVKEYSAPESDWQHLGVTPIDSLRMPIGIFRWKIEKDGYETVLAAASTWDIGIIGGRDLLIPNHFVRVLDDKESIPPGMVRVQGGETRYGELDDFFIDRHEVTNSQYKAFVDSGGYRNRSYWKHEFSKEGRVLSWEEAMAEFVDRTDRPGPSTWQAGDYPEGQRDHPVTGVSWYEAAAYAEFAGKSLPTGTHWGLARGENTSLIRWPQLGGYAALAPFSNFGADGPVPVGSLPGVSPYGAYDMAGNVREWCWNETPMGRLLRGGAWNDNTYRFTEPAQAPPFDRSSHNGFRCARYTDREKIPEEAIAPMVFVRSKDFYKEQPVSDAIFQVYKEQYAYDKIALNDRLESRDESDDAWIHEHISFDAAYGNERVILHLFLPKTTAPPYQTVVYFPGSSSLFQVSSEEIESYFEFPTFLSFLVKNGRAVAYPIYKGTFERRDDALISIFLNDNSYQYTDLTIQLVKDFKRSIDYLQMRNDIDGQKFAYYGMSWGGMYGAIIPAVEDRIKASILVPGGFQQRGRPEAHQINYIGRVTTPTLMLNGKYDTLFPYETSIKPMFDLLGTPSEHKKLILYETDHIPPRDEFIKETLAWLDRYLGPVGQ